MRKTRSVPHGLDLPLLPPSTSSTPPRRQWRKKTLVTRGALKALREVAYNDAMDVDTDSAVSGDFSIAGNSGGANSDDFDDSMIELSSNGGADWSDFETADDDDDNDNNNDAMALEPVAATAAAGYNPFQPSPLAYSPMSPQELAQLSGAELDEVVKARVEIARVESQCLKELLETRMDTLPQVSSGNKHEQAVMMRESMKKQYSVLDPVSIAETQIHDDFQRAKQILRRQLQVNTPPSPTTADAAKGLLELEHSPPLADPADEIPPEKPRRTSRKRATRSR